MNTDVVMNLIKTVPMFSNLGPVLQTRLAENSGSLKFSSGARVLEEGKGCNNLFIVASGRLEVYKKIEDTEVILQSLSRGDIFGEAWVMDGSPLTASVRAAESTVLFGIDRVTLNSMVRDFPEFSRNYIRYLGSRARQAALREENLLKALLPAGQELPEPYSIYDPSRIAADPPPPAGVTGQASPAEDPEEEGGESEEVFFRKEYACPMCSVRFRTLKPRQKHVIVEKADDDFCLYYKTVNPLYYEINVCPKCGFSFNNSTYAPMKADLKKGMAKMLASIWKSENYCGTRSLEDAVRTFSLALECHRLIGADDSNMGKLYLKLGWLYRYQAKKDEERSTLDRALYHLTKSFETTTSNDPKEEMNLMFLLGQLNMILGDDRSAVNWFVRITQHPEKKIYPYIVNRARDSWQGIRKRQ